MAAPIAVKTWMEFEYLLLRVLHYTDAEMCLSGKEFNNDELGHNKHMVNGEILLSRVNRVTRNHFSILPTPPNQMYPSTPPIKFIATAPPIQIIYDPFHSHLNYCIWFLTNQSQTSPFWVILLSESFDLMMSHMQSDEKLSHDWQKIVGWSIWALAAQKPCLYIIKENFLMALPSAFALLLMNSLKYHTKITKCCSSFIYAIFKKTLRYKY